MDRKLTWLLVILFAAAVTLFVYSVAVLEFPPAGEQGMITSSLPATVAQYPAAAELFEKQINNLSPTQSFDRIGWILERVSFVPGISRAYLEYTDTHVTLRVLVSYVYNDRDLTARVLATFLPDERGGWVLQNGRDEEYNKAVLSYIFDGNSSQWMPEVAATK